MSEDPNENRDENRERMKARARLAPGGEPGVGLQSVRIIGEKSPEEVHPPDGPLPPPPGADATEATRREPVIEPTHLFGVADVDESVTLRTPVPVGQLTAPQLSGDEKRQRLLELD